MFPTPSRTLVPWAWGATLILAAVLAVLTLTPHESSGGGMGRDKVHHLIGFGALAFPLCLAYPRRMASVLCGVILFGAAIELIQPHVGRSGEWADLLADALGALLAAGGAAVLTRAGRRWWPRSA